MTNIIVACLIRAGFRGTTPSISHLVELSKSSQMKKALKTVQSALKLERPAEEVVEELGGQTGAHEVVPMAVYHLYRTGFKFTQTLENGIDTFHPSGIDMDSVLSIAGSIAGMRDVRGVEESCWLDGLEDAEKIANEARALVASTNRQA